MAPFDRSHMSSYWRCIVTMGLSCIVSEIKRYFFYRKSRYFNTHLHGTPVRGAGGPCLNIAVAIVAYRKKTRIVVLAEGEESLRILFVSIQYNVHKRVRLTEGQTDTARRQRPRYAQRRAEKNRFIVLLVTVVDDG